MFILQFYGNQKQILNPFENHLRNYENTLLK